MFTGEEVASLFASLGVTHVVTVPDSTIGVWEEAIVRDGGLRLVRACREGEAWGIAAGLYLCGARPVILIQCTGLFESGDALRNVVHDWKLPVCAVVGYRSYLSQEALPGDSCLVFTEPVLDAWRLPWVLVKSGVDMPVMREHLEGCMREGRAGVVLLAEGRG